MKTNSYLFIVFLFFAFHLTANPWHLLLKGCQDVASYAYRTFPVIELYKGWNSLSSNEKRYIIYSTTGTASCNVLALLNTKGIANGTENEPFFKSPLQEQVLFAFSGDFLLLKALKLYLLNHLWIASSKNLLNQEDMENQNDYRVFIEQEEKELDEEGCWMGRKLDEKKAFKSLQKLVRMTEKKDLPTL